MKYSTKLSDTVHVMVLIAINQEKSLSSASIAESVHTNPGFVRQLMLKLKRAELMTSVAGHAVLLFQNQQTRLRCWIFIKQWRARNRYFI